VKINFIWAGLGHFFFLGSQWFVLLVMAWLGSPLMLGEYSLALGIVVPIIALGEMQLTQLQITDVDNTFSLKDFYIFRILALFVCFFAVLAILVFFQNVDIIIIIFIFIARAFASIGEIAYGYFQSKENFKELSVLKSLRGVFSFTSIVIPLYLKLSLLDIVICYAIVSILIFYTLEYRSIQAIITPSKFLGFSALKKIFQLSLPLGLSNGVQSLNANIPKYFLSQYFGLEVVGYFAIVSSPITWFLLIPGVLSQVIIPKSAFYFHKQLMAEVQSLFFKYTVLITIISVPIVILIHFFGRELLEFLYGYQYGTYHDLLEVLTFSFLIINLGSIGPFTLIASKSFWLQFSVATYSFVVTTLGCLFFLKTNNWTVIGYIDLAMVSSTVILYFILSYFIMTKNYMFKTSRFI
jgi:O-antigen/teichoic acid export membrane protein